MRLLMSHALNMIIHHAHPTSSTAKEDNTALVVSRCHEISNWTLDVVHVCLNMLILWQIDLVRVDLVVIDLGRIDLMTLSPINQSNLILSLAYTTRLMR